MPKNEINDIPVSLDVPSLTNRLQNNSGKRISMRLQKSIEFAVEEIRMHAAARVLYAVYPIKKEEKAIQIGSSFRLNSRKISRILRFCKDAVVFVATLGQIIDERITLNMRSSPAYGYVLDQGASLAVENAVQYVYDFLLHQIPEEALLTYRYSPGYCDWPVEEQRNLFCLIDSRKIGVTLNQYALMKPRKSVSGIIGICRERTKEFHACACSFCRNICEYYRKEPSIAYVH
jgi:hypothetical protein